MDWSVSIIIITALLVGGGLLNSYLNLEKEREKNGKRK